MKIILKDGTEITELTKNGDNFVSDEEIDTTIFDDNTHIMTVVDDDETETTLEDYVFCNQQEIGGKYYFSFRPLSRQEVFELNINSKIEYLSMMTGITL